MPRGHKDKHEIKSSHKGTIMMEPGVLKGVSVCMFNQDY